MAVFLNVFYLLLGTLALYYGADYLVRGGVSIAKRAGISTLVTGLTLVAFATSAPELAVSLSSALQGNPDIAVGNVIGSNIANIGLILGLCACILPLNVNRQLLLFDAPVMIISAILVSAAFFYNGALGRISGAILFILLICYIVRSVYKSKKDNTAANPEDAVPPEYSVWVSILIVAASLGTLVLGANAFLWGSVYFARLLKVSDAVIGLTVVAVGTSLPELATSIVAAIKGEKDIAIGNVVGSNIFNTLGILGLTSLVKPIHANLNIFDFIVMSVLSMLLLSFMASGKKINQAEGILLLLIYIGYIGYLVMHTLGRI